MKTFCCLCTMLLISFVQEEKNIKQRYEGHLQYASFMTHVCPSSQPFLLDVLFEVFFALPFPENIHTLNGLIC